jgi:glycosyltransferase involved in cell wall biosynthesis
MNKLLTIVIPCKNEGRLVIDTIKYILNQTEEFKIIVADSSTEGGSISLLNKYEKLYSNQIKIIGGGLPSVARNKGFEMVDTPYVLFLDADIQVYNKKLISDCLRIIVNDDLDLVTCKFKTIGGKYDWVYRVFDKIQWISSKTAPFALGGFMLFKTETFNKLGKFNENDKIAEDYHLSSKIKPKKFKVADYYVYSPARRFENKGVWYMIKLMFNCWLNRNNDKFYTKDYNYWS